MNHKFRVQETEIINLLSGGIAQLVERLPCTQEVSGSSPLTSTLTSNESKKQKSAPRPVKKLVRMLESRLQKEP